MQTGLNNNNSQYLALNNATKSWSSPYINIYDVIKNSGPGTYTIHAKVSSLSSSFSSARLILRLDQYASFANSDNLAGIGIYTTIYNDKWTDLTASFKVLPRDIESSSGSIKLCFDGLSPNANGTSLCIDDVIICKLNEDNITNGSFDYGLYGWRSWGGSGEFNRESQINLERTFYYGYYLSSSTYGSIACNVDQIMQKHGEIVYDVGFAFYLSPRAYEALDKMVFYLSSIDGKANCYIGQYTKDELANGWTNLTFEVDTSQILQGFTSSIFDTLLPSNCEVFLRMEYRMNPDTMFASQGEYGITNAYFLPAGSILANPQTIYLNQQKTANISSIESFYWYKFTPETTDTYCIFSTGDTHITGSLYNENGNYLSLGISNDNVNFVITEKLYAGRSYLIKVRQYDYTSIGSCTISIAKCCGGDNYNDVTTHDLQINEKTGYYICSDCKYGFIMPAYQDSYILSERDYKKVAACYAVLPYYFRLEESCEYSPYTISTSELLTQIDIIRGNSENSFMYEFTDGDGNYVCEYPNILSLNSSTENPNTLNFSTINNVHITYEEIDGSNWFKHNGMLDNLIAIADCFFIPQKNKTFFSIISSDSLIDSMGFGLSELAKRTPYKELSLIIDLIAFSASVNQEIKEGDSVVDITKSNGIYTSHSKIVFDSNNEIKLIINKDTISFIPLGH